MDFEIKWKFVAAKIALWRFMALVDGTFEEE